MKETNKGAIPSGGQTGWDGMVKRLGMALVELRGRLGLSMVWLSNRTEQTELLSVGVWF